LDVALRSGAAQLLLACIDCRVARYLQAVCDVVWQTGKVLTASSKNLFDLGTISETSRLINDDNTMTVELLLKNKPLPPGTIVTVTGLSGSQTAASPALPVLGKRVSRYCHTRWSHVPDILVCVSILIPYDCQIPKQDMFE
jgi:hypothetical protein